MTQPDERQYTLQELATNAGVSIRTIRYYIGEGLLPAPVGAGPQSHYTQSHANQLRAIGLLKDRYLPLKEIRKALSGLDERGIEALIADLEGADALSGMPDAEMPPGLALSVPASPAFINEEAGLTYDALSYIDSALESGRSRPEKRRRAVREERVDRPLEGEVWRKIEVADGVELLVRDDLFRRRHDRIEWLVDWARKVVD